MEPVSGGHVQCMVEMIYLRVPRCLCAEHGNLFSFEPEYKNNSKESAFEHIVILY